MPEIKNKSQKIVLITGGSRGIGAQTAKLFASYNYAVCINYKSDVNAANDVVKEITAQGGKCIAIKADVSKQNDVIALFKTIDKELGTISVLVNNAGILHPQMRLDQMDANRINTILTTNITSYFLCSREAIKRMSTRYEGCGGSIVNVSSVASKTGSANEYIDYASSKGAIDTLTIGLSKEIAQEKIRVNCVRPGLIYTNMHKDGGEEGRVDRLKDVLPMKRGGLPLEVAEAIYWLSCEKSSFSTGCFIDVAGGL
ncbi:MAG: SDR family oxidoreductase [Campylobacteraceae bacterium]|nr:SDR family oxidoreductase [Campylobacteraceae bacterium]